MDRHFSAIGMYGMAGELSGQSSIHASCAFLNFVIGFSSLIVFRVQTLNLRVSTERLKVCKIPRKGQQFRSLVISCGYTRSNCEPHSQHYAVRRCVLIDSFLQKCLASTYIEEEEARIVPLYIQFV